MNKLFNYNKLLFTEATAEALQSKHHVTVFRESYMIIKFLKCISKILLATWIIYFKQITFEFDIQQTDNPLLTL